LDGRRRQGSVSMGNGNGHRSGEQAGDDVLPSIEGDKEEEEKELREEEEERLEEEKRRLEEEKRRVEEELREVEASRDEQAEQESWDALESLLRGDVGDGVGSFNLI
jgi:ElaB/YqjD/DUF883 family membrane-anchored ribosome-binding protein